MTSATTRSAAAPPARPDADVGPLAYAHRQWQPIDIEDYEAIGSLRTALSLHAEEAFEEAGDETAHGRRADVQGADRHVRRPAGHAAADVGRRARDSLRASTEAEIIRIVDIFRRQGRSFLTPPAEVPLNATSIVDLSHESLMRGWARLIGWAAEERQSAGIYARVAQAATWWSEGSAGLWRNPELELGLRWRRESRPTAAWARRYRRALRGSDELPRPQRARAAADRSRA